MSNTALRQQIQKRSLLFAGLFFYATFSYSSELYFLCGPDEDGCFDDQYQHCACIPHDNVANTPHCLDFTTMTCKPLSEPTNCRPDLIFKNQSDCVATLFHSTLTTPCRVKTRDFCIQHHIQFCDHNAEPNHCHASPD